jgi:hypothetical protein
VEGSLLFNIIKHYESQVIKNSHHRISSKSLHHEKVYNLLHVLIANSLKTNFDFVPPPIYYLLFQVASFSKVLQATYIEEVKSEAVNQKYFLFEHAETGFYIFSLLRVSYANSLSTYRTANVRPSEVPVLYGEKCLTAHFLSA